MNLSSFQKKVIGVTGGIGAGKSSALLYLKEQYDLPVLQADEIGRELMQKGYPVYKALVEHYGKGILDQNQEINREILSELVLKTPESVKEVNEIEHPLIRQEIVLRIMQAKKSPVLLEAALLEEGNLLSLCDEVLVISVGEEVRIKRLQETRGYTRERCLEFIKRQQSDDHFRTLATVIIENNGDFEETKKELDEFIKPFL